MAFRRRFIRRRRQFKRRFIRRTGRFSLRRAMNRRWAKPELKYTELPPASGSLNPSGIIAQTAIPDIVLGTGNAARVGNRLKYMSVVLQMWFAVVNTPTTAGQTPIWRISVVSPRVDEAAWSAYYGTVTGNTFWDYNLTKVWYDKSSNFSNLSTAAVGSYATGQPSAVHRRLYIKFPRNVKYRDNFSTSDTGHNKIFVVFFNMAPALGPTMEWKLNARTTFIDV